MAGRLTLVAADNTRPGVVDELIHVTAELTSVRAPWVPEHFRALNMATDRTLRGHDLTLLQELQELTPAERIARNCAMAEWVEKLQAAAQDHATRSDLSKPRQ